MAKLILILCAALGLAACGTETVTKIDYLETDTFISSTEEDPHASLPYLSLSKDGSDEERTLIKLPTGSRDVEENLDGLRDPEALLFFPFIVFLDILEDIFSCKGSALNAASLSSAKLVFDIVEGESNHSPGALELKLTAKPWFQSANWKRAHPFSSGGRWSSAGGDFDESFAAVLSTQTVSGGVTSVEFVVTDYFRSLLANRESVHYGMTLKANGPSQLPIKLASTQYTNSAQHPRLEHSYTCPSGSSAGTVREQVYYLSTPR